jgi:hypothetical protein
LIFFPDRSGIGWELSSEKESLRPAHTHKREQIDNTATIGWDKRQDEGQADHANSQQRDYDGDPILHFQLQNRTNIYVLHKQISL